MIETVKSKLEKIGQIVKKDGRDKPTTKFFKDMDEILRADCDNTETIPFDRLKLTKIEEVYATFADEYYCIGKSNAHVFKALRRILNATRSDELLYETKKESPFMSIMLDEKAFRPTRAHDADAGLDLYSCENALVPAHGSFFFDTGVHVKLPHDTAGVLISKSGLNVKHGIMSTGLIDEEYTGSIGVKLYNNSDVTYRVERGDKISQLMVVPVFKVIPVIVNKIEETKRGNGGFGSTGKK